MLRWISVCGVIALPAIALAQETMHVEAATMPSPGTFVLREMFQYSEHGANPRTGSDSTTRYEMRSSLQIGLVRDLSLRIDVPVVWRDEHDPASSDKGWESVDLTLKYRFQRSDTAGLDTVRAALLGGVAIPSDEKDDWAADAVDPFLGAVVTIVQGRFGFNQDIIYRLNTGGQRDYNFGGEGPDDAFEHNTSLVWRLAPGEFTPESNAGLYAFVELTGLYETGGDYELLSGPGLMYEARYFALEAMVHFPVYQQVDDRAETDLRIGFGVRVSF